MNVSEVVCHLSDQIRLALGLKPALYVGNKLQERFLKYLILRGMPAPKGRVETITEIKQGNGGTKPTEFYTDKNTLIELIKKFNENLKENEIINHPAFGPLNKQQWGRIIYAHLNHHLKQFGR